MPIRLTFRHNSLNRPVLEEMKMNRSGSNARWNLVFRLVVGMLAIGYVVWKTWEDRETLVQTWRDLDGEGIGLMLGAVLLVVPNLGLEAEKWRRVIRPHYPHLKRKTAVRAVLAGMATGIFTPNRIGEYAGRVLYLEPGKRVEAVVGTFVDRISQLAVTLLAGLLVLTVAIWGGDGGSLRSSSGNGTDLTVINGDGSELIGMSGESLDFTRVASDTAGWAALPGNTFGQGLWWVALFSFVLILAFLLFPRFASRLIPSFLLRYAWVRKVQSAAGSTARKTVLTVFGLSLLRYLVFSTQYVLLLYALGWPASLATAYAGVMLVFLAKSVVPVPGILELGIRETIAIQVFTLVGLAPSSAVQSTFLLYLVNIILPTLLGVVALRDIRALQKASEEGGTA